MLEFKSIPEMFEKERSGRKNNTARVIRYDDERKFLLDRISNHEIIRDIKIINSENGENFVRQIKDATYWQSMDIWIITWRA